MRKNKWGFLIILLLTVANSLFSYEEFGEIMDPALRTSLQGMRSYQVHYLNWLFYTINTHTPGFFEAGVYNTRFINKEEENFRVDHVGFTRFRAGPYTDTGNPLDLYIDAASKGWFLIKIPGSYAYTRDGRFTLDSRRRIVSLAGDFPLMGENGEIFLPEGDISISKSGTIFVEGNRVDRIKIIVFTSEVDMQNLETLNGSVFVLTKPIPVIEGVQNYRVVQGALEENNVLKAINGDILSAKNYYESCAKIAHALNKSLSTSAALMSP